MNIRAHIATVIITLWTVILVATACRSSSSAGDTRQGLPDTLRVGTLYSPTSLFIFRGDTMGYEYERIRNFARDKNITAEFVVARNMESMMQMLDSGQIDIIAYEIPITAEYKNQVLHCGTQNVTHQVLVQRKSRDSLITDVTQLVGKDIFVEAGSKYESRLLNLDNEIGGGINIHKISEDSLITEDLIEMVSKGKIPFTIVDSDIARLNSTYFSNIDISLTVSFPQRASWAVRQTDTALADSVDAWSKLAKSREEYKKVLKRYFELGKRDETYTDAEYLTLPKAKHGKQQGISPYDHIFRHYAGTIGWDWRLLASQAWIESRFDTTATSWAGARGLMQIMPGTARAYGLHPSELSDPEKSVRIAVESIKDLNNYFARRISDPAERRKFIIAAYNSGIGHVADAIALAAKYGKNPSVWYGNVEEAILWKSNPEFYNDEVCRFGYFRGKQTVAYVKKVLHQYSLLTKQ